MAGIVPIATPDGFLFRFPHSLVSGMNLFFLFAIQTNGVDMKDDDDPVNPSFAALVAMCLMKKIIFVPSSPRKMGIVLVLTIAVREPLKPSHLMDDLPSVSQARFVTPPFQCPIHAFPIHLANGLFYNGPKRPIRRSAVPNVVIPQPEQAAFVYIKLNDSAFSNPFRRRPLQHLCMDRS